MIGCSGTQEDALPESVEERTDASEPSGTLTEFSRLVGGEWRMGDMEAPAQRDVWAWGPGRRSMHSRTHNSKENGETTSGVSRVLYWHPGRRAFVMQVFLWEGMYGEGVVTPREDGMRYEYELFYPSQPRRDLVLDWTFDGPDALRMVLTEDIGRQEPVELAQWDYGRAESITPAPASALDPPEPVRQLSALARLVGHEWEGEIGSSGGSARRVRATFEWIPYIEVVYARVDEITQNESEDRVMDVYIYHHTGTGRLRCLALSSAGGVHEGQIEVRGDGSLGIEWTDYVGDRADRHSARIEFEDELVLRYRDGLGDSGDGDVKVDGRFVRRKP